MGYSMRRSGQGALRRGLLAGLLYLTVALAMSSLWAVEQGVPTAAVQADPEHRSEAGQGRDYLIGIGDVLSVSVWEQKDISQDSVPVRPDGMISLPLIRDVRARGLTCNELADRITVLLRQYINNPTVTVVVRQVNSLVVYVLGQVKNSGALNLRAPVSLLQAISLAGGFTPFAKGEAIVVLRRNGSQEDRILVNYGKIVAGKSPEQNLLLQGGDTVVVP